MPIRITADLSIEILQARREWQDIFKVMKEKNLQPRLLYPAKVSFKYESESEVAQSCLTLCDPMDTRLLRPWDFLGKSTGVGCHFLLQRIFPTQGSNPDLPHCRQTLYRLSQRINQKLYRQAKAERIQYHQNSSPTNAKGFSLDRKHRKGV